MGLQLGELDLHARLSIGNEYYTIKLSLCSLTTDAKHQSKGLKNRKKTNGFRLSILNNRDTD